ncbi:MAG: tripartite tricarboxylate transporter TctB family protein [Desulfobacterales bacterium]
MQINRPKDLLTGVLFLAFGLAAMGLSLGLKIGTAARMGPGYFPFALGLLLAALGGVLVVRGLRPGPPRGEWPTLRPKPLLIVLSSVLLFSQVLIPLGLLLSTALLVVLSSLAGHEFRLRETLLNAAALVAVVVVLFVYLLEFPIPLGPSLRFSAP